MAKFSHQNLADGRWFTLTLAQQLGNAGSEVGRALNWQKKTIKNISKKPLTALWNFWT